MITITKRSATPPQPYESQTYARREDEAFTTKDAVFAVRQKVARPAHWIPGAGELPTDFFLPGLA